MNGMTPIPIRERLPKPIHTKIYARKHLHIIEADAPAIEDSVDLRELGVTSYIGDYLLAIDSRKGCKYYDTVNGVDWKATKFCITPEQAVNNGTTYSAIRVLNRVNVHYDIDMDNKGV